MELYLEFWKYSFYFYWGGFVAWVGLRAVLSAKNTSTTSSLHSSFIRTADKLMVSPHLPSITCIYQKHYHWVKLVGATAVTF